MKKYVNNERGYTLLVTFGIMMTLLLFMFSFTKIAVSQKQQVEQTDSSFVTTALAEMGGEYFKNYLITDIQTRVQELENEVTLLQQSTLSVDILEQEIYKKIDEAQTAMEGHYLGLTTLIGRENLVGTGGDGYRVTGYTLSDTGTIQLTTRGFTNSIEGNDIQVEFELPDALMWKSDQPELSSVEMSFAEYATSAYSDVATPTQTEISSDSNGFEFEAGEFYHFAGGRLFPQGQFNDNQGRSLSDINVYSDESISFMKQFKIIDSTIVTKNLFIEFTSNAQGEIHNSSLIVEALTINKGNQAVKFSNSSICFTGPNQPINLSDLLSKVSFEAGSVILYNNNNQSYKMTSLTTTVTATEEDKAPCSPRLLGTVATYSFESFNHEDIAFENVIYN